ncbi:MAG: glyoxalase, partial [Deltaproteobacteria bacterium]|nr:glyoxalase [Deltaproteobacteria bacterium]
MPIQGLDHINIHTSRLEETLRFYTRLLDFQEG